MTPTEFSLFLYGTIFLCAVMVVVNVAMSKKRGTSALLMAAAFLFGGGTIFAYTRSGMSSVVYVGAGVVLLTLIGDFVLRSARRA